MAEELIRPIDEETAKAVQEVAKLGSKMVDATAGVGRYLDRVLGRIPDNLAGFVDDWLAEDRIRAADRLRADTEEIRRRRGTNKTADVSPSVAIPLIKAAIDEDRDGLKELWARLLAAAMDPDRTHLVRLSLIELLKQLEPLDAQILQDMAGANPTPFVLGSGDLSDALAKKFQVSRDEAFVSLEHLYELGCLMHSPNRLPRPSASAKARVFVGVVSD
jgi:hypothetical protein